MSRMSLPPSHAWAMHCAIGRGFPNDSCRLVTRDECLGEHAKSMVLVGRSEYIGPHCRFTTVGANVLGVPIGIDVFMQICVRESEWFFPRKA